MATSAVLSMDDAHEARSTGATADEARSRSVVVFSASALLADLRGTILGRKDVERWNASTAAEANALVLAGRPDLLVVDARSPGAETRATSVSSSTARMPSFARPPVSNGTSASRCSCTCRRGVRRGWPSSCNTRWRFTTPSRALAGPPSTSAKTACCWKRTCRSRWVSTSTSESTWATAGRHRWWDAVSSYATRRRGAAESGFTASSTTAWRAFGISSDETEHRPDPTHPSPTASLFEEHGTRMREQGRGVGGVEGLQSC
jgi:hypothetical protein